jgi:hypothetical protein
MNLAPGVELLPLAEPHLPALLAMDAEVFGADRAFLLRAYWQAAPGYAFAAMRGGALQGYVLGRHGFTYEQAGPVVASEPAIARALLATVLSRHAGRRFLVDALLHDPAWPEWLRSVGFREQRPYMRMVRGPNRYPGRPALQYAILGPELG